MAIIETFGTRERAQERLAECASLGIPAGELTDISDGWRPSVSDYWTPEKRAAFQLWSIHTYIGRCLEDREANGYDDSDWYMTVVTPDGKYEEICFASTRGWTYPSYGSRPDASPELMAEYRAYLEARYEASRQRRELEEIMTPAVGKTLEVIKGRKIAHGTTGTCIYCGVFHRGYSRWADSSLRVGIKTVTGETVWTDAKNVQVV